MKLIFHIIYTPGTVQYLRIFIFSLLKWSDCSFRLVANGCSHEEQHLLKELCHTDPRLEFVSLSTKTVMSHGQALTYLQRKERSERFCFMDSDILATGDFLSEFMPYVDGYAGVFSGSPLWIRDDQKVLPQSLLAEYVHVIRGHFSRTESGTLLGNTFFAIYNNRALDETIQSSGIDFHHYRWQNIPSPCQKQIARIGLKGKGYDAGKVLNMMLQARGERLIFVESSSLIHIGDFSVMNVFRRLRLSGRIKFLLRLYKRRTVYRIKMRDPEMIHLLPRPKNKVVMCRYTSRVLQSLSKRRPLPALPDMGDPEMTKRLEWFTANVVSLYEEFGNQLR